MPLVRFEVRNEYALGLPELFKEADSEDPKAVLDGVAVAGLVGILRQLGDLAEVGFFNLLLNVICVIPAVPTYGTQWGNDIFAAEVFHGLQEQAMTISSRSHKLMVRVQNIEAAVPQLEKTILGQRSHLHFAYTSGSNWHTRLQSEQNQFIYNDLPRFIMDSYEECRSPPHLHQLDRFDTSGPGSCLKRYSDPTIFSRASAGPDKANIENVLRDKKVRRMKKKRLSRRNGELLHAASSNYSGRSQFASLNVDGQTSPSHTVSTLDATFKSDLGDQSISFDSRIEPGYGECLLHPSYSTKPETHESKGSFSSQTTMNHPDALDYAFLKEGKDTEDDRNSLSQEPTGIHSSFDEWNEKTEVALPSGLQFDCDGSPEMAPMNYNLDVQQRRGVYFRTVDPMDSQLEDENLRTSISGYNELDEIDSETDNYMDALNTIESESEPDVDCQTKREVEDYNSNNKAIEDITFECILQHVDHQSNSESPIAPHLSPTRTSRDYSKSLSPESHTSSYSSSNKETSEVEPIAFSSVYHSNVPSAQMADKSANPDSSDLIDSCGNSDILDGPNEETLSQNISSSSTKESKPVAAMSDEVVSTICEPRKPPQELSTVSSMRLWTNGGLLGLEPSKPPDFSALNASKQHTVSNSKDGTVGRQCHDRILEGDRLKGKLDASFESFHNIEEELSSKYSNLCCDDYGDSGLNKQTPSEPPPADLDQKLEQSSDLNQRNGSTYSLGHDNLFTGVQQPVNPDVHATNASRGGASNSSRMFTIGSRLLVNGFQGKLTPSKEDNFGTGRSFSTIVIEQNNKNQTTAYQATSGVTYSQYEFRSPIMSPSSSPPLEHMKLSFQPVDGFETSKLKLKFPNGSSCLEGNGDMFPTFQLVPEPTIQRRVIDSETDDDTFCRSSPYMSDDSLSDHSESNSEQWESGESPRNKDNELYDALCRLSSSDVSSSIEMGRIQSGHLFDLPSFDALNPSIVHGSDNDLKLKDPQELHSPKEPTPMPPPLPPLEWRAMRPSLTVPEDKQDDVSETPNCAFDLEIAGSVITQHPKPAPIKLDQIIEAGFKLKSQDSDLLMLNGCEEPNQGTNGKGTDEKEDFLHQIRTKSFSLRRTVTSKPTSTTGVPANDKVTAILEKANAIRQAVGSDDGEDGDSWSDT